MLHRGAKHPRGVRSQPSASRAGGHRPQTHLSAILQANEVVTRR